MEPLTVPDRYKNMPGKPTGSFDMNRRADYDDSLKMPEPETKQEPSEVNSKPVESPNANPPMTSPDPMSAAPEGSSNLLRESS